MRTWAKQHSAMFIYCGSEGISIFVVALVNCDENNIPHRCNGDSYILSAWTGFRFLRFPTIFLPLLARHSRGCTRCLLSSLVELELKVYVRCNSPGGLRLYILSVSILFPCLFALRHTIRYGLSYVIWFACVFLHWLAALRDFSISLLKTFQMKTSHKINKAVRTRICLILNIFSCNFCLLRIELWKLININSWILMQLLSFFFYWSMFFDDENILNRCVIFETRHRKVVYN
jgi:hypothetical protein